MRKLNKRRDLPPIELELTIAEADDVIMALNDAIDIAKQGKIAEIIRVGNTRVATRSGNLEYEGRIYPDSKNLTIKLI
mgnify:FL=1